MMRWKLLSCTMLCAVAGIPQAVMAANDDQVDTVTVVGVSPLAGTGIDIRKVPANVQVINPSDQKDMHPGSLSEMLDNKLGSVSVNDYEGNPLQTSLNYRGYVSSPLQGDAQGLAVYQDGMRLNEAFGDVVMWDLNPSFAIGGIQVLPGSNPVFGLNALGGAIALKMKDGFTNKGTFVDLGGGEYGRYKATAETGQQWGNIALYTGVSAIRDDGWRQLSPSQGVQTYTDLAVRQDTWNAGVGITVAATSLTGNGGAPTAVLDQSWTSVFTAPDLQQNSLASINFRGSYDLSDDISAQGNAYYRHLRAGLHNGNTACNNGFPCTYTTVGGATVNSTSTSLNATLVNSSISTDSFGFGGQLSDESKFLGLANLLIGGVSTDFGYTHYNVNTELGTLASNRAVDGSGIYVTNDSNNSGLTSLVNASNQYYGLYATDTLSLTNQLSWTLAGRYNVAFVNLSGPVSENMSNHYYQRFNPSTGLAYQINRSVNTYVSYAEANRAPTAAELGCADPNSPCTVQSALNSDPNLKQVVSRSVETGFRGNHKLGEGEKVDWNLGVYGARNYDDIIFVMTNPVAGQGYYQNAGITQRVGVEAGTEGDFGDLKLSANYAYTRATFQGYNLLSSPNNDQANSNGQIQVVPGDRMPGIPLHSLKLGASYQITKAWNVGLDSKIETQRVMYGDQSNTMNKLGAINTVGTSTSYAIRENAVFYARVDNLFNQHYAASGTVGDPTAGGLFPQYGNANSIFLVPGQPQTFWAGLRLSF